MAIIGYHCAHEQLPPSRLLRDVRHAETAGFDAAMCSDHLAPWSERQGESGHTWTWLGAAMQATSLTFGTVTAPGQRYHPAVHAQAMATVAELAPDRFWCALGSGEDLNEHVTGDRWPTKDERRARLRECVDVMRALLRGEEVTHHGRVTVDRARVWSLPATPPPFLAAAVSSDSARFASEWADGLITVNQLLDALREVLDAYDGPGPRHLQVHVSWAETEDEAMAIAMDQSKPNVISAPLAWDLPTPQHFDAACSTVREEDVRDVVLVSSDLGQHAAWLHERLALGFDGVYVHHVGKEQDRFIDAFADKVLPELRS